MHSILKRVFHLCTRPAAVLLGIAATAIVAAGAEPTEGGGRKQIAIATLSSINDAKVAMRDGLDSAGTDHASDVAEAIITWLTMIPSLECADLSRQATVVMLSQQDGEDMPDQIAAIPLSPINGSRRLHDSLRACYGKIEGKNVLYCSEPRRDDLIESLAIIITKSQAYVANSREGLRWLAQRRQSDTIPSLRHLHDDACISIAMNSELMVPVLDLLIGGGDALSLQGTPRLLAWMRDMLSKLASIHVSISADMNAWNITALMESKPEMAAKVSALPTPSGKILGDIPADSYCVADFVRGVYPCFLPDSILALCRGDSAYSFYSGCGLLPGMPVDAQGALEPLLAGERAESYAISKAVPFPARVVSFALSDEAKAKEAVESILSSAATAGKINVKPPRSVDGTTVWRYSTPRRRSKKTDEDYAANALLLLEEFTDVELAIADGRLLVIAGHQGQIDKWLVESGYRKKSRSPESLAKAMGPLWANHELLGSGQLQPTETLKALFSNSDDLFPLLSKMPRPGNGLEWRISRQGGNIFTELYFSSSEVFALKSMSNLSKKEIGDILITKIMDETGAEKSRQAESGR